MLAKENDALIEFWYDFASPYCYLAASRIEALLEKYSFRIIWRPILLGPLLRQRQMNPSSFQNVSPQEACYRQRDIERLCRTYDLPLAWPSTYPRSSLLAARLALIASREDWCSAFTHAIFHANFAEDRDIANETVIADILLSLGRPVDQDLKRAVLPETKEALKARVEQAPRKGIFGAPSFIVSGELFWGNDRLDQAVGWASHNDNWRAEDNVG